MATQTKAIREAIAEAQGLVGEIEGHSKRIDKLAVQKSDGQWRLAQLTHDSTKSAGGQNGRAPVLTLAEWAAQVGGLGEYTFGLYRRTWTKYGDPAKRLHYADGVEATFGDHSMVIRKINSEDQVRAKGSDDPSLARDQIDSRQWTPKQVAAKVKANPELLSEVAPAVIAGHVAEHDNTARAIARNKPARDRVENHLVDVRSTEHKSRGEVEEEVKEFGRKVDANLAKTMKIDAATSLLRQAGSCVGEAIYVKDRWGIDYPDVEAEELGMLKHLIRVYEGKTSFTPDDYVKLAAMGISTGEE